MAKQPRPKEVPDPFLVPMGERLAKARAALFKSQAAAARAFGMKPQRWKNYESGRRPIPLDLLLWLSDRHKVPSDYILADEPNPQMGDDVALKIFGAKIIELGPKQRRGRDH